MGGIVRVGAVEYHLEAEYRWDVLSAGWESVVVEDTGTDNVLKIHGNCSLDQCNTRPSNPVGSVWGWI